MFWPASRKPESRPNALAEAGAYAAADCMRLAAAPWSMAREINDSRRFICERIWRELVGGSPCPTGGSFKLPPFCFVCCPTECPWKIRGHSASKNADRVQDSPWKNKRTACTGILPAPPVCFVLRNVRGHSSGQSTDSPFSNPKKVHGNGPLHPVFPVKMRCLEKRGFSETLKANPEKWI